MDGLAASIASAGWAAWNIEYRRVGAGGGYPETFDDVAAGIDHLAELSVDTSTVVTLGHSAGGVISCAYTLDHQVGLAGLICESFAFKVAAPDFVLTIVKWLSRIAPHLPVLRHGRYERDLLASVIRFAGGTTRENLGDATVLTRAPKARIGESELTQLTSDYSGRFGAHQLLGGVDFYQDDAKRNNNFTTGLGASPGTTVGTPDDGAVRPDTRGPVPFNTFDARNVALDAQENARNEVERARLVVCQEVRRHDRRVEPAGPAIVRHDAHHRERLRAVVGDAAELFLLFRKGEVHGRRSTDPAPPTPPPTAARWPWRRPASGAG